jgi:hypothetical protein
MLEFLWNDQKLGQVEIYKIVGFLFVQVQL